MKRHKAIVFVALTGLALAFCLAGLSGGIRVRSLGFARSVYHSPFFGEGIAAGFGALCGSLGAYYLGRFQQHRDRHDQQHEIILEAWYALIFQRTMIVNLIQQSLQPLRNDQDRHLKMAIYIPGETPRYAPISKLAFLAKKRAGNLLLDLNEAEDWFRSTIQLLAIRNRMKERLDAEPLCAFDKETGKQILDADPRHDYSLTQITDALYKKADAAQCALEKSVTKLREIGKEQEFWIPKIVFDS